MGIFDFLKPSNASRTTSSKFSDHFRFDIAGLIEKSDLYKMHQDDNGDFKLIEYEVRLSEPVLKIFDLGRIRLWKREKCYNEGDDVGVTFLANDTRFDPSLAKYVVNTIAKCCNVYDDNWTQVDEIRIRDGAWRGRSFFIDSDLIAIEWDEIEGLSLSLTGFDKFNQQS